MKNFLSIFICVLVVFGNSTAYASLPYTDVAWNHKYAESIDSSTPTYFQGYEDGTFRPEKILTRAELLKVVIEAGFRGHDRSYHADKECFEDLHPAKWYNEYICFAKEKGLVNGYADGTFRPNDEINLVEALKIYTEANRWKYGMDFLPTSQPWYKTYVDTYSYAIPLDFTNFQQPVTRAQMANLLDRAMTDLAYMYPGIRFLYDHKVTYETLLQGINVEKIAKDASEVVDAPVSFGLDYDDYSDYKAVLFSNDAIENSEANSGLSCMNGYYSGNFKLAIVSVDNNSINQLVSITDLGERTIPTNPLRIVHFPIDPDTLTGALPPGGLWVNDEDDIFMSLAVIEEYENCNGNNFSFFEPGTDYYTFPNPLDFDDDPSVYGGHEKVYASGFESMTFDDSIITVSSYNNAAGADVLKKHIFNGDQFLLNE